MKTLIFDFFAVLVPDIYIIWMKGNGLEAQIPKIVRDHFYRSDIGEISEEQLYSELGNLVDKTPEQVLVETKVNLILDHELIDLIKTLSLKYKIALCSNAPKGVVERFLTDWGLNNLFDSIIISSQVGIRKPDNGIFDLTLASLESKPEEAVFIDDNKENIESAERLGIKGILFTDTKSLKQDLALMGII